MYSITKQFSFEASHHLEGLDEDHKCMRPHGHSYRVRVTISSLTVDRRGMVFDYGDLHPFGRYLDDTLDHRDLNEAIPKINPTAENLACHLHHVLHALIPVPQRAAVTVAVSETPKTWASWTG